MNFNAMTTTYLRTASLTALLTTCVVLAPSFVLAAAQPPAPLAPGTHPAAVPPTKAPTTPLTAKPLPNGQMTLTNTPTPGTTGSAPADSNSLFNLSSGAILYTLIALGIIALAGLGWFFVPRKGDIDL